MKYHNLFSGIYSHKQAVRFLLTIVFVLQTVISFGQIPTWQWAKGGGSANDDQGKGIAVDKNGNSYVIGSFYNSPSGFGSTILTNKGYDDIFIVKYDASGNVVWARSAGDFNGDHGTCVTLDNSENIYVSGYFYSSSITFGSTTLTNTNGNGAIFLVKYDPSGNVIWAQLTAVSRQIYSSDIATDNSGNIYLAGNFNSDTVAFGSATLVNSGENDIFAVKYDSSGNVVWARSTGGSGEDIAQGIAVNENEVYITGFFKSSSISFGSANLVNSGDNDILILKYTALGNPLWAKSAGGSSDDRGQSIGVDGNGNVYSTGYFYSNSVTFSPATLSNATVNVWNDMFLVKYDSSGNLLWAKREGSYDFGDDRGRDISVNPDGSFYIVGDYTDETITFGSTTLTKTGTVADIFVVRYNSLGSAVWAKAGGGPNSDIGNSIAVDGNGIVHVAGEFRNSTAFGNTPISMGGWDNVFVARLKDCPNNTYSNSTQTSCNSYVWNGTTYTTSGTYSKTISNATGCDSIMTLNLTIIRSTNSEEIVAACDSFQWNGNTYTVSGNYSRTIANSAGCDSIINLYLTINSSARSMETISACDSYTWNGNNYSTSGIYEDTISTAAGCDSIITLDLTINSSTSSSETISACQSYIWNGNTYSSAGTYTDTLLNASGCDSILTLNLSVTQIDTSIIKNGGTLTAKETGASYQWIDCDSKSPVLGANQISFTPADGKSYGVVIAKNGCQDTSSCSSVLITPTSADLAFRRGEISVYPNPSQTGVFNIRIEQEIIHPINIYLTDVTGREIRKAMIIAKNTRLDLCDLGKGIYFLYIGETNVQKLVIQ